jgi:hypothetical protein
LAAGVEPEAKAAGHCGADLGSRRRDRGKGGGAPRRISVAGVETAERADKEAVFGRRRRDHDKGGGPPRQISAADVETAAKAAAGATAADLGRQRRDCGLNI